MKLGVRWPRHFDQRDLRGSPRRAAIHLALDFVRGELSVAIGWKGRTAAERQGERLGWEKHK